MDQGTRTRPTTAADFVPEEEVATPASTPWACFWCPGSGRVPNDHHECYDRCDSCNGTGIRPDHRLAGSPSVRPGTTAA